MYEQSTKPSQFRQTLAFHWSSFFITLHSSKPIITMSLEKKHDAGTSDSEVGVFPFEDQHLPPSTGHILGSSEPHIFTNPYRAAHWKEVYDAATYEGRHRFDPSWTWSPKEELRLKKKVKCFLVSSSTITNRYENVRNGVALHSLTSVALSCSWTGGSCSGCGSCSPA